MISYIGSGDYCYANTTAMFLAAHGEQVSSSYLEVLCGVGLGALWVEEEQRIYFNNIATLPDRGITHALKLLGFSFTENWSLYPERSLIDALRADLVESPAILGPVDAGFLRYDPVHFYSKGMDHYVLALSMDDHDIYLHDPSGFQHVQLALADLDLAWKAEAVKYRRGSYSYWSKLQRDENPSEDEVYDRALRYFQSGYQASEFTATHEPWARNWAVGHEAIQKFASHIQQGHITPELNLHLIHFMFKLGARRALDFALFFKTRTPQLARLKHGQSRLFGRAHTLAVREQWAGLYDTLVELADAEEEFRGILLNLGHM